jgi:maltose-binding protein MalE
MWTKTVSAPYWKEAPQTIAVTPIPTFSGQGNDVASTLSGWDFGISATSKHKKLAFDLISLMEDPQNIINSSNWIGWIPPDKNLWTSPAYTSFAPYQDLFGKIALSATVTPTGPDFPAWAQGFETATGLIAQNPKTTVAQAVQAADTYITQQLGAADVEKLK